MITLKGEHIMLRGLEPSDLDFLYLVENDETVWEVSNTSVPFSKYILKKYIENSHRDIFDIKQLRLVICLTSENRPIGFVDLFDFEPKHHRVGLGIIIFSEKDRGKGHAYETLKVVCKYAQSHLNVHQLYANIIEDNVQSIQLFEKAGFMKTGIKKRLDFFRRNL